MTTTRLPRSCSRKTAELARELRKPWPPRTAPESTAPRHAEEHSQFRKTGEKAA